MAYTLEKFKQLKKTIEAWKISLEEPYSDITRDAAIQRFEFTFELLWKTVKIFLKEFEGIECQSPKSCFRESRLFFKLSAKEVETCLQMTEDGNVSVHVYSEKQAKTLYKKLSAYLKMSEKIAKEMNEMLL